MRADNANLTKTSDRVGGDRLNMQHKAVVDADPAKRLYIHGGISCRSDAGNKKAGRAPPDPDPAIVKRTGGNVVFADFSPCFPALPTTKRKKTSHRGVRKTLISFRKMVLPDRIGLSTSPSTNGALYH